MKKIFKRSLFCCLLIVGFITASKLSAQLLITVPDYCYGYVEGEHDNVLLDGSALRNPYPESSYGPAERTSGLFLAKGFRWWGYPPEFWLNPCYELEHFDYPGSHGIIDWQGAACGGTNPSVGYCAGWGGVIVDPAGGKIICLNGAASNDGPTIQNCIRNWMGLLICYPAPSIWGESLSYGYLRKTVVVQSTGILQQGDPVEIRTTMSKEANIAGDGSLKSFGMLFLNKLSETILYAWGGREYLTRGEMQELKYNPAGMLDDMLAALMVEGTESEKTNTVTVAVGDTIVLELMFEQAIQLINPRSRVDSEGWAGEEPGSLFSNIAYIRTDSVKNIVRKNGNALTYDLTCLTQGAILTALTPEGPNVDEDEDGISDSREKGADGDDNNFDGNSDGIPDFKQPNVASFHTYDGLNYVTLSIPDGIVLSEMKVTNNPSPSNTPADAEFPWGFFDFSLDGLDPGEAVTVTLFLHNGEPAGKYYKYGMTPDNNVPHWYEFTYDGQTGAQINDKIITLHFVDGLRGDEDITVNCSIKEPGGPAKTSTTGIAEFTKNSGILIYPNPGNNLITLKLNNIIPAPDYSLNIYSVTGSLIHQKIVDVIEENQEFLVPVDHLPGGLYLIILTNKDMSYQSRFIKTE
ncbi:MAG: T9SS type A sorting domain-containing protein [Bacteroidales bacterium]|nr:T9SS type A sorting domain-containing protein [Bacteroidales bacterium]